MNSKYVEQPCKISNYDGGSKYGYFRLVRYNTNAPGNLDIIFRKVDGHFTWLDVKIKHKNPTECIWNCRRFNACGYKKKTLDEVELHEKKCIFCKIWCKYGCGYNGWDQRDIKRHEKYCDQQKALAKRTAEREEWKKAKEEMASLKEEMEKQLQNKYPISDETCKEMQEQAFYITRQDAEKLIQKAFPKSSLKYKTWNHGIHISGRSRYRVVSTRLVEEIYLKRMQPKRLTYSKGPDEDTEMHFVCGDFSMTFAGVFLEVTGKEIPSDDKFAVGLFRTYVGKEKIIGGHVMNIIIVHDNNGKATVRLFEPQNGRFLTDEEIKKSGYDTGAKMAVII